MATPEIPVEALKAVRRRVFQALADWERTHPTGSARPVFDHAYRTARALERADHLLTVQHREWLWREWLEAGQPLTAYTRAAILARLSPAARAWLAGVPTHDPTPPGREPGEDDGDEDTAACS